MDTTPPARQDPASRDLLLTPHWHDRPLGERTRAVAPARRLIVLCDADDAHEAAVRRRLPGVSLARVDNAGDGPAATYRRAATRLLGELQRLLGQPHRERRVVQVVCPARSPHGYAGLLGMLRSAALEEPALAVQLVEFTPWPSAEDLAGILQAEQDAGDEHVRYVDGHRQLPQWRPARDLPAAEARLWRPDGVYLVTGGAGGIGRLLAADLARHASTARLVVCGRRAPDGVDRRGLAAAEYIQADVTDAAAVAEAVDGVVRRYGRLDGIVHAAGLLRDGYVLRKSHQELHEVLGPKVAGLVHLDEACSHLPLDFLIAFSSGCGSLGNPGQADYAAANGFMDAYLSHRRHLVASGLRHGRSLSLAWPLWREGGMRVAADDLPALAERFGHPLDTATALGALHRAVRLDAPHLLVTDRHGTGTDTLARQAPGAAVPRSAAPAQAAPSGTALRADVLPKVKELLATTLRLDADRLDADAPLDGFGIDSLAVTRLNRHLERWFGTLPKSLLYQHPTLRELAHHLADQHPEGCRSWLDGEPSAAAPMTASGSTGETTDTAARPTVPAEPVASAAPTAPAAASRAAATARPLPADEPIAVIGLSGRYPDAPDIAAFWRNLRAGRDSVREIPAERWPLDGFFEPDAQRAVRQGASYSKWGAFLDDFARFDAAFFGIAPRTAADMDPQERLFIECAWAVLEDAGYTPGRLAERHGSRVGVFVGVTKTGFDRHRPDAPDGDVPPAPRTSFASLANRVSYLLDLRGPSMPVDTMCSASLTAVHEACEQLRRGACELAIAGGVNLYLHPSTYVDLCRSRMLASGERCRSFGEGGDGFVPGEGVGAVLLKPLSRAEADGDPVHAVILGSSVNHGGRSNGYTVPNPRAQAALVREALARAGVTPAQVGYVEAHGTGTRLGDPVEIDGLTQAFTEGLPDTADRPSCALGTVKPNIGHLEAAAGIAGLTKAVLQLKHGELVPSLHADPPNPEIDFAATPFTVQTRRTPWAAPADGRPRVAGVSSFGAGGANAHVVLAEYRAPADRVAPPPSSGRPFLLPLSARTPEALRARAERMAAWLDDAGAPVDLGAVAFTLQTGREEMDERLCFVAARADEWREQLAAYLAGPDADGPWGRDRVRTTRETRAALADKPEVRELVGQWAARGEWLRLAAFWAKGMPLDWTRLHDGDRPPARLHLPTYPFAGPRYWFDTTRSLAGPATASAAVAGEVCAPTAPAATPGADAREVERVVLATVGDALQMPAEEIDRRRPFADLGLDSILGVNVVQTLNETLGTALETTDLFDHGSVERLRTFIVRTYGDTLRPSAAPAASPAARPRPLPAGEPIAVVGLAARFADAPDPRALWRHIAAGDDLVGPVTRWDLDREAPGVSCRAGSFVDGIDRFDPVFFGISGVEAAAMDPQQRIFLEECWNALEDAGYTGERLTSGTCGVYVGCYAGDYHEHLADQAPAQALWGTMGSVVASRIAYHLDLTGPALSVDTSCSSSLVALHLACRDLRAGAADMALAGGVFIQTTPRLYVAADRAGMLSPSGRCRSFDADADGFVPGEGAGVVVLKRLSDAERDGDHVYGLIRGTGVNQDGTTNGITAPSAVSQERLLRAVHEECGITPGGIQLVEAHGTGTPLGDPIEFRALRRVFEGAPAGGCSLGSVKTNLGHTQFAAGVAGVIKALLALRHRQLPPTLHFTRGNPAIALEGSPFRVDTRLRPWPRPDHGPRRAAVSSFGASGTNAHVVLEEYAQPAHTDEGGTEHAFLLSARTPEALRDVARRLVDHLGAAPALAAGAVAHTLAAGRRHFDHRLAVVAADLPALAAHLRAWLAGTGGPDVHQGEVSAQAAPYAAPAARPAPRELARAYVEGRVDRFADHLPAGARRVVPLPTYPFERDRYWAERAVPADGQATAPAAYRWPLTGTEFFLADHHVGGRPVLPAVVSLEAVRRAVSGESFTPLGLRDVVWPAPFAPDADGSGTRPAELRVELGTGRTGFRVHRAGAAPHEVHAQGRIATPAAAPADRVRLEELRARCDRHTLTREQCYAALGAVGIRHGERLRALDSLAVGDGEVLARLVLPEAAGDASYALHPAMLDAAIQAVVGLYGDGTGALADHAGAPALPFALDAVDVLGPTTDRMWAHLRHSDGYAPSARRGVQKADIDVYDDEGRLRVSLRGYSSRHRTAPDAILGTAPAPEPARTAPGAPQSPSEPVRTASGQPRPASDAPKACLLAPVWDALPAGPAPRWPAPATRLAVLGGTAGEQAEILRRYPNATLLGLGDADSPQRLAALLPSGVEHAVWLALERTAPPGSGTDTVLTAFRLVKALLADGADARELGLTVITRQACRLTGDRAVDPAHAGVHGLFGTVAKEYPHWRIRVADIGAGTAVPWDEVLALPADPRGETLAHRDGEWYRRRLLELTAPAPTPGEEHLRPGDVVVAIGGAGGIGTVWTEHVMRRHGARVVWIGRRPLDETIEARRTALAEHGPRPDYVRADATDPAALRAACEEIVRRHGPVRAVLHTAIVLGDQSLARMDEDRFRATYAAKADVSVNLADAFGDQPLRFVAFFSSMQAFFKAPGQANYAAGCTFSDAWAEHLRGRLPCPVKVMNWGYWAGVGIVTADDYRRRMKEAGLASIEPDEGMAAYDTLLTSPYPQLALLKATHPRSIDGLYGEDAVEHHAVRTPSLIAALRDGRPDRRDEIGRLRVAADGHAGSMHDALLRITWALLRSLGLFDGTRAATADEWRATGGITDDYARWTAHTLHVLTEAGHLRRDADGRYAATAPGPVDLDAAWRDWDAARALWEAQDAKRAQAVLVDTTLRALTDILTGRRPATDVMFPNSSLRLVESVYRNNPVADYFNDVLADTLVDYLRRRIADDPAARIRILEVGAGTGGTSAVVFRRLRQWSEHVETYCYTDLSKAFLLHARREYGDIAPYLDERLLNIERPLAGQSVRPGDFDVVVATNVLHATRNIRTTLRNVKAALRPHGVLLLNELSDNVFFSHLTFGLLQGWWRYDDPAPRIAGSPGLTPATWRRVLGQVGFRGAFVAAEGADDLGQQVIVAESDGAIRQPRPDGVSAFRGVAPPQDRPAPADVPAPTVAPPGPDGTPAPVQAPSAPPATATVPAPGEDLAARLREAARDFFRALVADTLRLPLPDIKADVPLERYGIDSILVVQLTEAVRAHLRDVGSTLFFEVRTVDGLVDHFLRTQPDELAALVGVGTTAPAAAAARPDPGAGRAASAEERPPAPAPLTREPAAGDGGGTAIAVVGMAGRYPGARDLDAFWENLLAGRDSITEIPAERWDHDRFYDPRRGVPGRTYSKWGGFIDGVDEFDPLFFGIAPSVASTMDPQERLFLQCAYETLQDAGYTRDALRSAARRRVHRDAGDIGVFVGAMYTEYQLHGAEAIARGEHVVVPGSLASIANQVSYFFDASGPSVAVDTMCASALTALHLACAAIRSGECAIALAGGVNVSVHPSKYLMIGQGQFASSDGRCRSFGEGGDGYVPGEGVGAVLLRPLADAVADGDRILGVIRGTAVNHGGRTHGFTVPNPHAQAAVIRSAWRQAGIDPRDIQYVEAHGTGTSLGDPIEIAGLKSAFTEFTDDRAFCAIGSAKSNIGHLESAAGIAGLAKILLQMRHGRLVPSLHAERTNPHIDFADTPFVLQREAAPWPRPEGRPRLAALSAFGAGGSNAHLVVEEYVMSDPGPRRTGSVVAVLSAQDTDRLRDSARRLSGALRSGSWSDDDLADIAYTLQVGREAMDVRFAVVTDNLADLLAALDACADGTEPPTGAYLRDGTRRTEPAAAFAADDDFQDTVARWAARGKLAPLAEAWTHGLTVDWTRLYGDGPAPRRVGLPTYPFARERYWFTDTLPQTAQPSAPQPAPAREPAPRATPAPAAPEADAPAVLPAGHLTLAPVWEPVRRDRAADEPGTAERVLAVNPSARNADTLRRLHPDLLTLHTADRAIDDLSRELASYGPLDRVVAAFPTTPAASGARPGPGARGDALRRAFRFVKALLATGAADRPLELTLVTRHAFDPGGTAGTDPEQAGLHGLFGGLAKECPQWRVRAADLADGEPLDPREVFALPADHRAHPCARRGGQWLQRRLIAVDTTGATAAPDAPAFRRDGVYVLIGGAGDLGVRLSEHLVRRYGAHVVWVGRRAEDAAIREAAARVGTHGPAPLYLSADATDRAALARVRDEVLRRHGRVDGLVHMAMVFTHTPLTEMDEAELDAVRTAKAAPCEHLAEVFAGHRPDFVLLVSSLVSQIRNPHQAHYAAACAIEDASASALRRALGCPVKVVNWGYWGNTPAEHLQELASLGVAAIDPQAAMAALERLLAGPLDQIGFMRTSRPLPVEGAVAGEVLSPQPTGPVAHHDVPGLPLPPALAAYGAGPVPGEIDDHLCRCLAAELRRVGLDQPRDADHWARRTGAGTRFGAWLTATLRALTEHGLIDAEGRWAPGAPGGADADALRAGLARAGTGWAAANADLRAPLALLGTTLPALGDILLGRRAATDVLFPGGSFALVEGVYRDNRVAGYFNAVLADQVVAHLRARRRVDPQAPLRVLEIGAGTGGTTVPVLDRLEEEGLRLDAYCFTDVSQAFLQNAQDTFGSRYAPLDYRVLDIGRAPREQGFGAGEYDVVIAANVLHATSDIRPALRHAKSLLRGGGLLALNEISGFYLVNHLTFGLLDGWWQHDDTELRVPGSPALSPENWQAVLAQEGFTGIRHPAAPGLVLGQQIVVAVSDGVVRLPRAADTTPGRGTAEAVVPTAEPTEVPAVRTPGPAAAPSPLPAEAVADVVLGELAGALRMPAERIDTDRAFADYGLDSIVGAKFIQRVNDRLGLDLMTTVIFDHRSVRQLAAHITESHDPVLPTATAAPAAAEARTATGEPAAPAQAPAPGPAPVPAAFAGPARPVTREPIAIVGISGRFAGSADLDALWEHLAAGHDLVGPIERWDLSGVGEDELSCRAGSFLDGIDRFDARFFQMTGLEATYTDPQQRLFLEQAWIALENAGHVGASLAALRGGVYVGCTGGDYTEWFDDAPPAQAVWGNAPSIVPARIAYHLDLHGPAIAVDTACSSSLVAVHLACQGLWTGETDIAVAGGVSVQTTPLTHLAAGRAGMLSPTGRCHTFDSRADGFVPGEGVGVVVLRRLSDALADGDHVHAVIRGSGLNQDGATNGITAPSALSQERLIRQVYGDFGIDPADIGLVEAHGTGTQLGDPIEFDALRKAFGPAAGPGSCALGSVKTNLGHTTSAAGVAGLLKVVLSLRHEQIPPTLHHHEPNPAIRLDDSPFYVNTEPRRWAPNAHGRRMAAVSSFGFSGTNAHLVVESAPARAPRQADGRPHLFVLSAPQPEALHRLTADLAAHLRRTPDVLPGDVSHTLALGRRHFAHRAAYIADDCQALVQLLEGDGGAPPTDCGDPALEDARSRYLDGATVDFAPLFAGRDVRRTPLPTYPFQRKRYWVEGSRRPDLDAGRGRPARRSAQSVPRRAPAVRRKPEHDPRQTAMNGLLLDLLQVQLDASGLDLRVPFTPDEAVARTGAQGVLARWLTASTDRLEREGRLRREGERLCADRLPDATATWRAWERAVPTWRDDEGLSAQADLATAMLRALPAILSGRVAATDVMFPDGSLGQVENLYRNNGVADYFNHVVGDALVARIEERLAADPGARLRIIEIGAGTGGTSALLFPRLRPYAEHVEEYRYTDLSKAFLLHARENYGPDNPYLRYQTFDVGRPPQEQGLTPGSYDVAVATNVLHATADIRTTVRHVRALLADDGMLLLNEISGDHIFAHLTFGLLQGWWLYRDDELRMPGSPALHPHTWRRVLREEGFAAVTQPAADADDLGQQVLVAETGPARSAPGGRTPSASRSGTPAPAAPSAGPVPAAAASDGDALRDAVADRLLAEISRVLMMEPEEIDPQASFSDFGVDSLLGVKLVGEINRVFGLDLATTTLFEHSTLDRLADLLVTRHEADVRTAVPAPTAPTASSAPSSPAPAPAASPLTPVPASDDAVAVIGIAARYAQSPDAEALWAHLAAGDDLVTEADRWDLTRALGEGAGQQYGSFLDDIARFDAGFFRISGKEATYTDPQQRVFLEECWHALEDAGYAGERLDGRDCGVYVGAFPGDYHELIGRDAPPQTMWGNMASVIASRISYFLDLQGPAESIDTACSSSLVAIHHACQDLRLGVTSMALAGGVFVQSTPRLYQYGTRAGMLSPSGRCHTFDSRADGFVPGEGAGVVVLKRLADALRDGDHVYGVIRGSGVNQDGTTNGITAPSATSQERLLRGVYERAGVDPGSIQLIEAHGTGTPLGDPIEFEALCQAFGDAPEGGCALGAIKTNLGHTQFAAGVAGVVKVLLALKHRQLPPSLHFSEPNPAIALEGSPFRVTTELETWPAPATGPRLAGVSSFGASGTNAHVLIEEAPVPGGPRHPERSHWLLVLSGQGEAARRAQVERFLAHAETHDDLDLGDVTYTLATGRRHCTHRLALVATDRAQVAGVLRAWLRDGHAEGVVTGESTDKRGRGDRVGAPVSGDAGPEALAELAAAYVRGATPRFADLFSGGGFRVVPLPGYAFGGERHWVAPAVTGRTPAPATEAPPSPLAGHAVPGDGPDSVRRTELTGGEFFLDDHRVRGVPVLPGVAYLELACAAARAEGLPATGLVLRNVVWSRPARIERPTTVETVLRRREDGSHAYEVASHGAGGRLTHGQGRIEHGPAPAAERLDIDALRTRCATRGLDHEACYRVFDRMGMGYGPALRALDRLDTGPGLAVARLRLPRAAGETAGWTLHPSLLDAAVQATVGLALTGDGDDVPAALPFAVDEVHVLAPTPATGWAVARSSADDRGGPVRRVDIDLCDDTGRVCVRLLGFQARTLSAPDARQEQPSEGDDASLILMRVDWQEAEPAPGERPFARHDVLLAGLDPVDPAAVTAALGRPCTDLSAGPGDAAQRYTARAAALLAHLRQAVLATRDGEVLVQLAVPAHGDDRLTTGLGGMLASARQEHPRLITQLIEVDPTAGAEALAAVLRQEAAGAADETVRRTGGRRLVPRWEAVEDAVPDQPWKAGGVYLVTGGAGGLGALFAREIARQVPGATLVLCGRSPEGPRQAELLRELRASGSDARYRSLDVGRRDDVTACVRETVAAHGRLDGILHTAGVLRDGYLAQKTAEDLREVFTAKVSGFVHLDEASADLPLDWFIGFSSLSAFGNPGQADYAAANAFLDAYAARRADQVTRGARHGRTLVVGWPLWADGGMRVDEATARGLHRRAGMLPMPARQGIAALYHAYGTGLPHVMAVYGDRARVETTLLAAPKPAPAARRAAARTEAPAQDRAARRTALLRSLITDVSVLLEVPEDDIDGAVEMSEYGFDSISLTEFATRLNDRYDLSLAPTLFFEYPTLGEVADHLLDEYGDRVAPVAAAEPGDTEAGEAKEPQPRAPEPPAAGAAAEPHVPGDGPSAAPTSPPEPRPRTRNNPAPASEPVAVVGVSCRFPQAGDLHAFWENLREGRDCIGEVPADRWDWRAHYGDPVKEPNTTNVKWGGFMDGVGDFDPMFFGISPKEAMLMDPQQRLLMLYVWKALEDAGYSADAVAGSDMAIFVGTTNTGYGNLIARHVPVVEGYSATGSVSSMGPNRMSNFLDVHGPSEPVETACSSSLVAIHRAVQALREGQSQLAVAGGVQTMVGVDGHISFSMAGMLAVDGRCKTFSDRADGYVRG
ncbi:SDR family NAD(P)-dependent oxidoreductase, partial [Streptomyces sp. NPDC007206]|uniref:SDR family NAD(P)-dependent oxidoreductase n=1 Tax=Streptomyces sp. NPDC007206 TaxID=3154317 RepID=UPI0033E98B43